MSPAAKRHMGRVASIGCIVCRRLYSEPSAAQVHHIREGRIERNDWLTLPLCEPHHLGTTMSVHKAKPQLLRALNIGSEFDLLADVIELLAKG